MTRCAVVVAVTTAWIAPAARAQDQAALAAAEAAWNALAFDSVLITTEAALAGRLGRAERVRALELRAFAFNAMDSTERVIETFQEMVYLDPDRDYDPQLLAPRLIQLHRLALGRELVVRGLTVDSTSFVAGSGAVRVRFETTRPATFEARVAGPGVDTVIGTGPVSGATEARWGGTVGGAPAPAGAYRVTVTVSQFDDRYTAFAALTLRHGAVDTLPHLDSIAGLAELPELEPQPRNWLPLALSAAAAGVATGAAFAIESGPPEGTRIELFAFDLLTLGSGALLSLRQPPPRPLPSNIEFNRRVRVMLAQQNAVIAHQNEERRRLTVLTAVPAPSEASP